MTMMVTTTPTLAVYNDLHMHSTFFSALKRTQTPVFLFKRPISQIPQCIRQISHNASFCNRNVHMAMPFENGDFWQTCPHLRRQNKYFWIVRFLATGIIFKRNSWVTTRIKIKILSNEFLAILFCINKSKLLMICFSPNTIQPTKSPPQGHLALRKDITTKSYWLCYLKAKTVGLSVATMYRNVQHFVWLPWQPFK